MGISAPALRVLSGITIAAVLALAACERGPRGASPRTEAQQAAARDACIARELAQHAQEGLAALQAFQQEDGTTLGVARAALAFAAAAEQHAQLRYSAIAYTDSAFNHSRTPEDSARYMTRSDAFEVRVPRPGTLEENISAAWMRDYAAIRADEDHRCNWDV